MRATIRAATLVALGSADQIEVQEVPVPDLHGPNDVLVEVRAAALNHLDLFVLGGIPGVELRFPHIVGSDGAGVVTEVGQDVTRVTPGDRVIINPGVSCYQCERCIAGEQVACDTYGILGEHYPGTVAEQIVVHEANLAPLPGECGWAEGAAFSLVTLTAWHMVIERAKVRPDDWVLVWGIGGGVSLTAMRIAKLAGATVIATSSSDAKLARARELGADFVINHREADVPKTVRQLADRRGVDVVIENVGEATWADSLLSLDKHGRLVTCGGTTGSRLITDVRPLFWHQFTIMGSTMGTAQDFRAIAAVLARGELVPVVDGVFPLDDVRSAYHRLEDPARFGKVVIAL